MKAYAKFLKIEGKLSLRDMNMIIFAIIMPIIILVILGIIYGNKPAGVGMDYTFLEQSFGALCSIAICAGGLMGLPIVISDYRERKILKHFKVTPVSPIMLLLVELTIYALYAAVSVISLFLVARIFWNFRMRGSVGVFLGAWFLVLFSILSVGMLVGGVAKNSKQASVIACILYFPMLVFSGATLPYEIMPVGMQRVVAIMPLTQGIKLLKQAVLGLPVEGARSPIIIMIVIAVGCIAASIRFFRWE